MTDLHQYPPQSYDDEIDLRELFSVLWDGRWLICGITFATAVIAVIVTLMMPNIYRAEALLAPRDQEAVGGLSALATQYGGLASLAGISLPTGGADKTALGLEILKSRKFISEFIERHDILVPLMAADEWDAKSGKLKIDPTLYDTGSEKWVRNVSPPKNTVPSAQEAYEVFTDILSVSQDNESGFVTVSIEHYSPTIAKQWVDWLVDDLNATVMKREVREAEQAIEYLNLQIQNTSLTELRSVFFRLIEEQTKTVMLARVSNEYLLKTLDPAVAPESKAKPNRSLIVVVATVLGGLFGVIIQLIRSSILSGRAKAEN